MRSSPTAPSPTGCPVSGSTILGLEARCGPAERTAPVLGLIDLVGAEQEGAARLGHAEHVVPQFGIGGSRVGGHDRVEVAAPHRRQVAVAEAVVPGEMRDGRGEPVGHRRALCLQQVEGLAGVDGVRAHQRGSGDEGGEQTEGEAADPEERRVAEQPVLGGQPADRVEVPLVASAATRGCGRRPWARPSSPRCRRSRAGPSRRRRPRAPAAVRRRPRRPARRRRSGRTRRAAVAVRRS